MIGRDVFDLLMIHHCITAVSSQKMDGEVLNITDITNCVGPLTPRFFGCSIVSLDK